MEDGSGPGDDDVGDELEPDAAGSEAPPRSTSPHGEASAGARAPPMTASPTTLFGAGVESEVVGPLRLPPRKFAEDRASPGGDGWSFTFHGYLRAPLRLRGSPKKARPPYLVDDNYFQSGFAYTRVNETEYAELFLGASHGRTRFVVGLMATQFSDWSETSLQGQSGITTAFAEHDLKIADQIAELSVRAGMFWDRFGYIDPYDTYLLGRMHMAGLRLKLRLFDLWETKLGFGAHADVISSNQGFTPLVFAQSGVDLPLVKASLFLGLSWTGDSERSLSVIKDGSLRILGAEAEAPIPYVGTLHGIGAFYRARQVLFLANAYEVLHSTGGRGLTQNFFGSDSDDGTGEALVFGLQLNWEPARALEALAGPDAARVLRNTSVRFFGMLAWLASNQASENPLENFDQRVYLKWGIEPIYRPHLPGWDILFASLRYDRVILDTAYDSRAFRVLTPKVGFTPVRDLSLDIFLSYSRYWYGEFVSLRPNQIPGDRSVTKPDKDALKLQAQVSW